MAVAALRSRCQRIRPVELSRERCAGDGVGRAPSPAAHGPAAGGNARVEQRAEGAGRVIGLLGLVGRSLGENLDRRESLATRTLEVTQVLEVRRPQRIVGEVAREQQSVDMRVKQLTAEIGQVKMSHSTSSRGRLRRGRHKARRLSRARYPDLQFGLTIVMV
jgi:hypothetical protein